MGRYTARHASWPPAVALVLACCAGCGERGGGLDLGPRAGSGAAGGSAGTGNAAAGGEAAGGQAAGGQAGAGGATAGCSPSPGVGSDGLCSASCGAAAACDALVPGQNLESCQGGGSSAVQDRCAESCQPEDQPGAICREQGVADCIGDPACAGQQAATGSCGPDCKLADPCAVEGHIVVSIDGEVIFDRTPAKSLVCLGLHYEPDQQYGSGPPGAQVKVTKEQPGLLEAELLGFKDDHENCGEKWGFVYLKGNCADVYLEKWNENPCSPYYTDKLKLETWVDTNNDCAYSNAENDELYGGGMSWDPAHGYALRIEWQ
ncbi:MAG: hypothetical protein HY744_30485 [Deltaproteobacteria bacterium]|nr:hypothetical protein [Deltaproteobacteria bacterium]